METPSVSILMGSYNPTNPAVLHAAVNSIITQTRTDWELLICDDGSDEPYASYLRTLTDLDSRIQYIRSEKNCGLANALNLCMQHARGRWIARMDDDDISEPERLEKQVRFLETHAEFAWAGTQALLFYKDNVWGRAFRPEYPSPNDYLKYSPYIHPSVMFRRDALEQVGGYCVSRITARCEDYELFMRLNASGYRGYNLPETLFRYREDPYTMHKRNLHSCFCEAIIRFIGFKKLGLLRFKNIPHLLKPLVVGILTFFPHTAQRIRVSRFSNIQFTKDYSNKD